MRPRRAWLVALFACSAGAGMVLGLAKNALGQQQVVGVAIVQQWSGEPGKDWLAAAVEYPLNERLGSLEGFVCRLWRVAANAKRADVLQDLKERKAALAVLNDASQEGDTIHIRVTVANLGTGTQEVTFDEGKPIAGLPQLVESACRSALRAAGVPDEKVAALMAGGPATNSADAMRAYYLGIVWWEEVKDARREEEAAKNRATFALNQAEAARGAGNEETAKQWDATANQEQAAAARANREARSAVQQAFVAFQQATAQDPNYKKAFLMLAGVYYERAEDQRRAGAMEQAVDLIQQAAQNYGRAGNEQFRKRCEAMLYVYQGLDLWEKGDRQAAHALFAKAVDTDTTYPEAHQRLAASYYQQAKDKLASGDSAGGAETLIAAADEYARVPDPYRRGSCLGEAANTLAAAGQRERAGLLYLAAGEAYTDAGNYLPEAAGMLALAMQDNPGATQARALFLLGWGHARSGEQYYHDARKELEQAIALDPANDDARFELAQIYRLLRDYNNAITQLQAVVQRTPARADAHALLGDIYLRTNMPDRAKLAEQEYTAALAVADPKDTETLGQAYRGRAAALREQKELKRAADDYRKDIELLPLDWATRLELATVLIDLNEFAEARARLQEVIQSAPAYRPQAEQLMKTLELKERGPTPPDED